MYGFVNSALEKLIRRRFGTDKWEEVIAKVFENSPDSCIIGDDNSFKIGVVYDESVTYQIIEAATDILGLDADTILEMFGEQFLLWCQESGYAKTLQLLGRSIKDFLTNLDALHDHLTIVYKEMRAPSFRCSEEDGNLLLHYYSHRKLDSIVIGVVKNVGRELYGLEVDVSYVVRKGPDHDHSVFCIKEIGPCSSEISREILYPESPNGLFPVESRVTVTPDTFRFAFPFHIIFDFQLEMVQVGISLDVLLSHHEERNDSDRNLLTYFTLERPHFVLSFDVILTHINTIYVLRLNHKANGSNPLQLVGQMIHLSKTNHMLFLCSPRIRTLKDLEANNMFISDIPIHDAMRALIIMKVEKEMLESDIDLLESTRTCLDTEMGKMKRLLNDILPVSAMEALMANQQVEAELFKSVTILFSDIEGFTAIGHLVEPQDVVKMLDELYRLFDKFVDYNGVYKVETIGDAYMVVGGLPTRYDNHAEKVCNQALDMMLCCQDVKSPVDGNPINIRIGIHSGKVVAGVVGNRMPRYCLFGDTVNIASRTESSGVAGKIQVTEATYKLLKNNADFKFGFRKAMEFKNVAEKVPTYWLMEARGRKVSYCDDIDTKVPVMVTHTKVPPEVTTPVQDPSASAVKKPNIVLFISCVVLLFSVLTLWDSCV